MSADDALIDRLAAALRAGGAVVVPTDTVYGVAALPTAAGATMQLFALKDRSPDTPLTVLVADVAAARRVAGRWSERIERLVTRFWPGPLTVVLSRAADLTGWELGGDPTTIGVRVPDHELVRRLITRVGPIATTSANRHGLPTPETADQAAGSLAGAVALVADGGRLSGQASTVVDATTEEWTILRPGPISQADLDAANASGDRRG